MIQVRILKKDDYIQSLTLTGHAGFADKGKDLICAGVSSISIGLCNALDKLNARCKILIDSNLISISEIEKDELTQIILQTGIIQLQTVEEQAGKYLKINILEV